MDAFNFISRIRHAGFRVELVNGNLAISPASNLNDHQRQWIRLHKPELVSALRSPGIVLESGQPGNDIESANDGSQLTVPGANLGSLRTVIRFQLKNGQGGSLLGEPGKTEAELRDMLVEKYGARLETLNGAAP